MNIYKLEKGEKNKKTLKSSTPASVCLHNKKKVCVQCSRYMVVRAETYHENDEIQQFFAIRNVIFWSVRDIF